MIRGLRNRCRVPTCSSISRPGADLLPFCSARARSWPRRVGLLVSGFTSTDWDTPQADKYEIEGAVFGCSYGISGSLGAPVIVLRRAWSLENYRWGNAFRCAVKTAQWGRSGSPASCFVRRNDCAVFVMAGGKSWWREGPFLEPTFMAAPGRREEVGRHARDLSA